jgi:hypothetical protein
MKQCKCGSQAINPHMHGRDGTDLDLCDVCYWRKRAEKMIEWAAHNGYVVDGDLCCCGGHRQDVGHVTGVDC